MVQVRTPDFVLKIYADNESARIRPSDEVSSLFLTIKERNSLDGGLQSGGMEKLKVDIGGFCEGEISLSADCFILHRKIHLEDGSHYLIEYVAPRRQGYNSYFGNFTVTDNKSGRKNPFYNGAFQISVEHFLHKYMS